VAVGMKYHKHVYDRKTSDCQRNISNPFMLTTFVLELISGVLSVSSLLVNQYALTTKFILGK